MRIKKAFIGSTWFHEPCNRHLTVTIFYCFSVLKCGYVNKKTCHCSTFKTVFLCLRAVTSPGKYATVPPAKQSLCALVRLSNQEIVPHINHSTLSLVTPFYCSTMSPCLFHTIPQFHLANIWHCHLQHHPTVPLRNHLTLQLARAFYSATYHLSISFCHLPHHTTVPPSNHFTFQPSTLSHGST